MIHKSVLQATYGFPLLLGKHLTEVLLLVFKRVGKCLTGFAALSPRDFRPRLERSRCSVACAVYILASRDWDFWAGLSIRRVNRMTGLLCGLDFAIDDIAVRLPFKDSRLSHGVGYYSDCDYAWLLSMEKSCPAVQLVPSW